MLTVYDELPHETTSDPSWRESWYMNFFDHEQELYGVVWMGIRPNLKHGEVVFALYQGLDLLHLVQVFDFPISETIGESRVRFGPVQWELVEPFKRWRMRVSDGACQLELEWEATAPAYNWEWTDLTKSWHYEHPGAITGTVRVADRSWNFRGFGERDRAWGNRENKSLDAVFWMTAQFGPDLAFHTMPMRQGTEDLLFGFLCQEGRTEVLSRLKMDVAYAFAGGPPSLVVLEGTDTIGRKVVLKQELLTVIPMITARDGKENHIYFTFNRYTCGERKGYGMMDFWWARREAISNFYDVKGRNRGALFNVNGSRGPKPRLPGRY